MLNDFINVTVLTLVNFVSRGHVVMSFCAEINRISTGTSNNSVLTEWSMLTKFYCNFHVFTELSCSSQSTIDLCIFCRQWRQ